MIDASQYFTTVASLRSNPSKGLQELSKVCRLAKSAYLQAVTVGEPLVEQVLWARRVIHLSRGELFWPIPVSKSGIRFNALTPQERLELAASFETDISAHPLMKDD